MAEPGPRGTEGGTRLVLTPKQGCLDPKVPWKVSVPVLHGLRDQSSFALPGGFPVPLQSYVQ
jgi:hypothetical protein